MSVVSAKIKTKKGKLMEKNEMFEKLVSLKTDCHTALFSDDGSAVKRDEATYQEALSSQNEFTDEEIHAESVSRWNAMIAKMNEQYRQG